jgi:ParB family chromosome partitioning protein
MKKRGLGKGLDALFSGEPTLDYFLCPIEDIRPNRYQPRRGIDLKQASFKELVASIKERGVLQPLIVTPLVKGYELITGGRRLEAAREAGLKEVPVIARKDIAEMEKLEMAIIENIQREDLTPLEEAEAYYRLLTEFGLSQEEIAKKVGKDRSTIGNLLRLRQLPDTIKEDLNKGCLTMGHARALLGLPLKEQLLFRDEIIKKDLSVRQIEKRIQDKKKGKKQKDSPSFYQEVAEKLREVLGTRVKIRPRGKRVALEIIFSSKEELSKLFQVLVERKWN